MRAFALLLGLSGIAAGADEPRRVLPPYTKPTLIAHRGASAYAPEHTLEAYRLALEQGADFVEPDLQVTKDGVLVCLHDTTLERTTNVRTVFPGRVRAVKGRSIWPVADFTLAEIQTLDAVRGKAGIIPETKAPEVYGQLGLNMEQLLMETLAKNGLDKPGADPKTPVVIQSFSADSLKLLRKDHGCKLPLVYLIGGSSSPYATTEGLKKVKEFADGVAPNKAVVLARPELVKDAHELGMSVTVWTFRADRAGPFAEVRKEMARFLRELKVDAVFADNPDQFPRD